MRRIWLPAAVLLLVVVAIVLFTNSDAEEQAAKSDDIGNVAGPEASSLARLPPPFPDGRPRLEGKTFTVELWG